MAGIEVDTEFIARLPYLDRDIDRATRRALKRLARWLRSHLVKKLSVLLNVQPSVSRRRFKVYSKAGTTKLWLGVNDLGVHYLGEPFQDERGVRVHTTHYRHAFINPMRSSQLQVWQRQGKDRLPIERMTENIEERVQALLARSEKEINHQFKQLFEQEIQHAIEQAL